MVLHKGMVQARRFWRVAGLTACLLAGATAAFSDFVLTSPSSRLYYTHGVVAGGRVQIAGGTRVVGDLHANGAVHLQNGSTVEGDVSAAGKVTNQGTVTGEVREQISPLVLPALQSDAELRALADRVLTGNQTLANAIVDDVLFVQGDVRVTGTLEGEGTVIATGRITVESGPTAPQEAKTRLSLIARGDIRIDKDRHFRGALYAGRDVDLQKGLRFQGVVVAGRDLSVDKDSRLEFLSPDTVDPSVTLVRPQNGAILDTATPTIEVRYTDDLSGIDVATVRFELDGTDRTAQATVGAAGLTFTPTAPLADGLHTIEVTVADNAGNEGRGSFTFTISTGPADTDPPVLEFTDPPVEVLGTATPDISLSYSDAGSGVVLSSLRVSLDGTDLTASCTVEADGAACPSPVLANGPHTLTATIRDGAGNTASATYPFTVVLDDIPPVVVITSPADGATVRESPVQVTGTVTDQSSITRVTVNGQAPTLTGGSFSASVSLLDGDNAIHVEAEDDAGNTGRASVTVRLVADQTPPSLAIVSPVAGSFVLEGRPVIEVTFADDGGIDAESLSFTANGSPLAVACEPSAGGSRCTPAAALPENSVTIAASIADTAGNSASASVQLIVDTVGLEVAVTSPAGGTITRDGEMRVEGTVSDGVNRVRVNGVPAILSGGTFTATVPLREGVNMLVALATKASGRTGSATVEVTRDLTAPIVRIDTPRDGFVAVTDRVTITGQVNDPVTGGVVPRVVVNGVEAQVSNGAFVLLDVPLVRGPNTLEAVATDAVGNEGRNAISVIYQVPAGDRIMTSAGDGQGGFVLQTLSQPLVAVVTDNLGNPVAGRLVRFAVTRNSGTLQARAGDEPERTVQVPTDGNGRASVLLTLGDTAGEGTNRVVATALGVAGEAEFCASGFPLPAERILMSMGDNQRGVAGQPLPMPLIALVVDAEGNPVPGVDVTFEVARGDGHLDGGPALVRRTGLDGQARAALTLGLAPGINNNVVNASFSGSEGMPAAFTASALAPGDPAETRFSGVVLDNAQTPIPGTEITIADTSLRAITDAQGQFEIVGVPVGHIHIHIHPEGSPRPETFAPLAFETVTVAGQNNTLGQPILLPALDMENSKIVGGNQDVTLTMQGVEGLALTVFANSATFHDGSRTGRVVISQVHLDKVPMAPPGGAIFMAPTWTIQPHGVHFHPPARITIPNNGLAPGRVVDIYQFDHALNQFISIGKGTVSEDGATITSDPGFGITAAGWGGGAPPPPPPTCVNGCDDGDPCTTDSCVNGSCRNDPRPDGTACDDDGNSCTMDVCMAGMCAHPDITVEITDIMTPSDTATPPGQDSFIEADPIRATARTKVTGKPQFDGRFDGNVNWRSMTSGPRPGTSNPNMQMGSATYNFTTRPDTPLTTGSRTANPALAFDVTATVRPGGQDCGNDRDPIRQDERDILRQEYRDFGPLGQTLQPQRNDLQPPVRPEYNVGNYTIVVNGTLQQLDDGTRNALNAILAAADTQAVAICACAPTNTQCLDANPASCRGARTTVVIRAGTVDRTVRPSNTTFNRDVIVFRSQPAGDDEFCDVANNQFSPTMVVGGAICAGPNGRAETTANTVTYAPVGQLRITSGYRNPRRNVAAGSVTHNSPHTRGRALDIGNININGLIGGPMQCVLELAGDRAFGAANSFTEDGAVFVPCDSGRVDHLHVQN